MRVLSLEEMNVVAGGTGCGGHKRIKRSKCGGSHSGGSSSSSSGGCSTTTPKVPPAPSGSA